MPPRVILIGPMGSGKTAVGKSLAAKLSIPFRDTDHLIEISQGKKVADIFVEEGEEHFRLLEKAVLRQELLADGAVLSLGGGAPVSQDAQSALLACGAKVFYLDVSLATVAPRIGFNASRPLLVGNPRAQWQELMQVRRPIYEKIADVVVDANGKKVPDLVNEIIEALA